MTPPTKPQNSIPHQPRDEQGQTARLGHGGHGRELGAGGILDALKEGLSRLANALPDAASALAVLVFLSRSWAIPALPRVGRWAYAYYPAHMAALAWIAH